MGKSSRSRMNEGFNYYSSSSVRDYDSYRYYDENADYARKKDTTDIDILILAIDGLLKS